GLAPWRTIATESLIPQTSTGQRLPGDPNWTVNFHRPPYGATGDAYVSVVFGPTFRLWTHRAVALDTNGVEHPYHGAQGTPFETMTLWTYSWENLPLTKVKEFRFQVRPLHWVEFPNIALTPRHPVPPPVSYQFTPVQERTFAELIDF